MTLVPAWGKGCVPSAQERAVCSDLSTFSHFELLLLLVSLFSQMKKKMKRKCTEWPV